MNAHVKPKMAKARRVWLTAFLYVIVCITSLVFGTVAVAQSELEIEKEKVVEWFKKTADGNNPEAQFMLGFIYEKGEGVTQDDEEAVKWYKRAAGQGFAPAQEVLTPSWQPSWLQLGGE